MIKSGKRRDRLSGAGLRVDSAICFRTGADGFPAFPAVEVSFSLLEIINGGAVLLICDADE